MATTPYMTAKTVQRIASKGHSWSRMINIIGFNVIQEGYSGGRFILVRCSDGPLLRILDGARNVYTVITVEE